MLLPKMLSSRQKVLRNSEPIFPYGLSELGILDEIPFVELAWAYLLVESVLNPALI